MPLTRDLMARTPFCQSAPVHLIKQSSLCKVGTRAEIASHTIDPQYTFIVRAGSLQKRVHQMHDA